MMILRYNTKKELKQNIGRPLKYIETSMHGDEYKPDGTFVGCNRPHDSRGMGTREFFAQVTMKNGLIHKVS